MVRQDDKILQSKYILLIYKTPIRQAIIIGIRIFNKYKINNKMINLYNYNNEKSNKNI